VQRIGMVGLHRENLAVERLGVRQPPGLVMLNRDLKRLRNIHIIGGCGIARRTMCATSSDKLAPAAG
jgi:hypothetical protein